MRVLFIGNSFTARNNVPGTFARLAQESAGIDVEWRLIQRGGASLKMHWNKGETSAAIAEGDWDHVVLQEQSTLPWKSEARFHENVRLFVEPVRASGANLVLYQTWARLHQPEMGEVIALAYEKIAEEVGATVVPAGRAWMRYLAEGDAPPLHDADGSHPASRGSLLAAACFCRVLAGATPSLGDPQLQRALEG